MQQKVRKQVASYLAIKLLATHYARSINWLIFVSVHVNTIPAR